MSLLWVQPVMQLVNLSYCLPEAEEGLLCESRAGRGHGQDEGGDPEGLVDGHQGRAEGGRALLAAEEEEEAEEAADELEQ